MSITEHKHKRKTISQSASTDAYVNDVPTEHKHKKKAFAHTYVAAAYVYAYACVASEDRALGIVLILGILYRYRKCSLLGNCAGFHVTSSFSRIKNK